jgi:hypothetical protein
MATDGFISHLMAERDQKVTVIENLAQVAADEGRDLHETDLETIQNYRSRIKAIDNQIEKVAGDLELADSVKTRVRALDPAVIAKDFTYQSAGHYLWDAFHRSSDSDANMRWNKYHSRAAQHMGYDKANTVPTAGGFNGLVVSPVEGAVLDPRPAGRPLFSALGVRPMSAGTFMRPRIVDPNFDSGVGPQTQEKAELVSKAWDILSDPVQGQVIGGYINISQLLIEMLPSGLDMIVSHMNRRLEYYSEVAAVNEMSQTTETIPLAADADSAAIQGALGQASATVFANTGNLPTWLAMGPTAWGRLIGTTDLAGRPLVPAVGPVNANAQGGPGEFFTTFAGMRVVVSFGITDADMYLGNPYGLEVYEKPLPVLQSVEPSVFGRQLSVQTMLAFYRPVTAEAGAGNVPPAENNGVVKIDWA